ncbi:MAG: UDP-N-acetylmuramoyl-tripeptide--D-alanyl-D-alanine ligase [Flavobacteriales bacterium]|nr:UDP-N-acetylmuramoyl-tripeptide--D-alanyl-D-alanine ligase [Flavobacteriales bacterium]
MIEALYRHFLAYPKISTDTRKIEKDSIFFALKGPNFNANQFALQALEAGAAMAVVDDPTLPKNDRLFLVKDVLEALQQLAQQHRDQLSIPVLALTGSNGKTTTKELIHSVLSEKFRTLATKGNLNNHIGVPLTLLEINANHEFAIIEMGANHQKEIEALCTIAHPTCGLITNIGKAHIEGFGGEEGIKKGKGELFDYLKSQQGKLFVNGDSSVLMEMAEHADRLVYGSKADFFVQGKNLGADPFLKLEWIENNQSLFITTQLIGKYNFDNAMAAIAIGKYFGLTREQIKHGLEKYLPENNRSQIVKKGTNVLIMDAYNANPSSMKVALENFAEMQAGNKRFIIGDMLELGDASEKEHWNIVSLTEELNLNGIFVGPIFGNLPEIKNKVHFATTDEAMLYLKSNPIENTHILVKGSRGMKLERLSEVL